MRSGGVVLAALCAVTLIGGCSPYTYGPEIKSLRDNFSELGVLVGEAQAASTADWRAFKGVELGRRPDRDLPRLAPDCAARLNGGPLVPTPNFTCDVVVRDASGTLVKVDIYPLARNFASAKRVLSRLQAYGDALAAITDARDSDEVKAAATGVCTTAAAIATAAGGVPGPLVGAGCALAAFGLTTALNERRYQVLRDAVTAVDTDLMPRVDEFLSAVLVVAAERRLIAQGALAQEDYETPGPAARHGTDVAPGGMAGRVIQRASLVTSILSQPPDAAVKAMVKAHHELAEALRRKDGQTMAVALALSGFADALAGLRASIK